MDSQRYVRMLEDNLARGQIYMAIFIGEGKCSI
jgi:hypothetical protein